MMHKNVLSIGTLFACLFACISAPAQDTIRAKSKWLDDYPKHVGLTYTVGADVVSNYIWRGLQVAGLGVQPDLAVGYGGFYIDAWASLSATDWTFTKPCLATGTAFYPELDISLGFSRWGLDIKYMHIFYFSSQFFDYDNYKDGSAQQEWRLKYRVSNKLPLHFLWCTRIWGRDGYYDENGKKQRTYSSYMEVGYEFGLPYDLVLDANIGMTPWKSFYTLYQADFAVVNMHLKLHRSWNLSQHCYMNAFAELMINPYDLSRSSQRFSNTILDPTADTYIPINGGQKVLWNIGCGFYLR